MEEIYIRETGNRALRIAEHHGFDNRSGYFPILTKAACECAEIVKAKESGRLASLDRFESACEFLNNMNPEKRNTKRYAIFQEQVKDTVQDEMADVAIFIMQAIVIYNVPYRTRKSVIRLPDDFTSKVGFVTKFILNSCRNRSYRLWHVLDILEQWMKSETGDDITYFIDKKMEYNRLRPYRHGYTNL